MRSFLFKSIIWLAIATLIITAIAPVFYTLAPTLLPNQQTAENPTAETTLPSTEK